MSQLHDWVDLLVDDTLYAYVNDYLIDHGGWIYICDL